MTRVLDIALKEYATTGITGKLNNARVLQYFQDIKQSWVKDDDTAWCAAFLNWCLLQAGKPTTGSLLARSFLKYGKATKRPVYGDIVVLWREKKDGIYGHCGLFIREVDNVIYMIGGNQNNSVNVAGYPKEMLLGYRKVRK